MRPDFKTKIFLDSGDPKETEETMASLGFLDGQTTNPSLFAKNPEVQSRVAQGKKFSKEEILDFYKAVVAQVSRKIPQGSVSVEVYADNQTSAEEMLEQGRKFNQWIPNAHIKLPTTSEGLKAAEQAVSEGLSVNMTLVFSQSQAAAVYSATRGAKKGQVFLSPFIGRLDDRGENGMDLIKNILQMYKKGDGHVEVLAASVRSLEHIAQIISRDCDILTAPGKLLKEWAGKNFSLAAGNQANSLKPIVYEDIFLDQPWQSYDISHELTSKGLEKFASDWNALLV